MVGHAAGHGESLFPELGNVEHRETVDLSGHSGFMGVHTFSIVADPAGDGFLGYAGTKHTGPVDRWRSRDLTTWTREKDNPILNEFGLRWPTVVTHDGTFYMAARRPYGQVFGGGFRRRIERYAKRRRRLNSVTAHLERFDDRSKTAIGLFASEDGRDFEFVDTLVDNSDTGRQVNQNPHLLYDSSTENFVLLFYAGEHYSDRRTDRWGIHLRSASTPEGLMEGSDGTLLEMDRALAAPSMFSLDGNYVLLTERLHPETERWATEYHLGSDLKSRFRTPSDNIIYGNGQACASPYVDGDDLYVFVSQKFRGGRREYWDGKLHRYSLA